MYMGDHVAQCSLTHMFGKDRYFMYKMFAWKRFSITCCYYVGNNFVYLKC